MNTPKHEATEILSAAQVDRILDQFKWESPLARNSARKMISLTAAMVDDLNRAQDPVVEANREELHKRSQAGYRKYGIGLHDSKLSTDQIVQHALEEALDLSNYLRTLLVQRERNQILANRLEMLAGDLMGLSDDAAALLADTIAALRGK